MRESEQSAEDYRAKCEEYEASRLQDQVEREKIEQALLLAEEKAQRSAREQALEFSRNSKQKEAQIAELTQSLEQLRRELSESRSALGSKSDSDSSFATYKKRTEVMGNSHLVTDLRRQVQTLEGQKDELETQCSQLKAEVKEKMSALEDLKGKCEALQQEIATVRTQPSSPSPDLQQRKKIAQLERELKDAIAKNSRIDEECRDLQHQLRQAANTEFSDPATVILNDQVRTLEARLQRYTEDTEDEKAEYTRKIDSLEQLLETARAQLRKRPTDRSPTQEEPATEPNRDVEKRYVEAKMSLASVEMERDVLIQKYKEAQERLRQYSQQYTELEVEFYKINERFGQTINAQNELELEIVHLRQQVADRKKGK